MGILDIFSDDGFSVLDLTGLVNNEPYAPKQLSQLGIFEEEGVTTTTVAFDKINGVLTLVGPTPRGGPGETVAKDRGSLLAIPVEHFQRDDAVMADEVQGRRMLGSADMKEDLQRLIVKRSMKHFRDFDATLEHQRIGAIKGIVLDKNGNTRLNLFTAFDESAQSTVDFDLDNANPASGAFRKKCDTVIETIEDALGADSYDGIHAICGRGFYRDVLSHKEVVESFKNTAFANVLRAGMPRTFEFGDITWERYRTGGASGFVNDDECHLFPVGVPELFKTYFAPADYIETVNTEGFPRYVKQVRMDNDKGIRVEIQSNPLSVCRKPQVLVNGTKT